MHDPCPGIICEGLCNARWGKFFLSLLFRFVSFLFTKQKVQVKLKCQLQPPRENDQRTTTRDVIYDVSLSWLTVTILNNICGTYYLKKTSKQKLCIFKRKSKVCLWIQDSDQKKGMRGKFKIRFKKGKLPLYPCYHVFFCCVLVNINIIQVLFVPLNWAIQPPSW